MLGRDAVVSLLRSCGGMRQLKQLHALMVATALVRDVIPLSKLLDFCVDDGDLDYAASVFVRTDRPTLFIWNSMIRGFSSSERPAGALRLYRDMQRRGYHPDHFTFPFVLKACAAVSDRPLTRCVHARSARTGYDSDLYVSSSLLRAYASCGDVGAAEALFRGLSRKNVVGWTTMIAGYVQAERPGDAIRLFGDMVAAGVEANEVTMASVLAACAQSRDVDAGRAVHRRLRRMGLPAPIHSNAVLATALLDMYGRCGRLATARALFDRMPTREVASWNAMIGAYNQYRRAEEVMGLFPAMRVAGVRPDKVTLLGLLGACAQRGEKRWGEGVHALVEKVDGSRDIALQTALLNMYAKAGETDSARLLFGRLEGKDVVAWTGMMIGLATHGRGQEAMDLFEAMQKEGVAPDGVAFVGILSACSHCGLLDAGRRYFEDMTEVHGITPTIQHYGCMVDLLSRAGLVGEAEQLVASMPVGANAVVWGAMLAGCRLQGELEVAGQVAERVAELGAGSSSGVYVLLSNIYAGGGRWRAAGRARASMRENGVVKAVAYSSVEHNGGSVPFYA